MNDDRPDGVPPDNGPQTAQPDPAKRPEGWQMPEPKFQQTSGYLPQGYLDQAGLAAKLAPAAAAPASPVTSPDVEVPAEAAAVAAVEPQPDPLEFDDPPPTPAGTAQPAKQRSTAMRVAMILLGLAGMIAFIAVFLAVIYYLFLRPADGSGPF